MNGVSKKERIARRIAKELKPGFFVNLGIGIPTLVGNYIPEEYDVFLQSENGLLGIGPYPLEGQEDCDLTNAGKETITTIPGSAFFSSADSFAMIRGGHVDATNLGAIEVTSKGDLANYMVPGKMVKGMGGAMDLVAGSRNVIVAMMHTSRDGESKILTECSLPLTGTHCVNLIVSDLAVIEVQDQGLVLKETSQGVSIAEVREKTSAELIVDASCQEYAF